MEDSFLGMGQAHYIYFALYFYWEFPDGTVVKNLPSITRRRKRFGFNPWLEKIPWSRKWQPTLVFLPGKSHGQRSFVGYSSWGCKESDTTDHACTALISVIITSVPPQIVRQ
ncbi:unnamed protein product [Rangifer tarandus platyrhynchus]|uniref:Uncharacterized protein n=1 Tax=Rangifer tarandus platyrhynchus TaxID=3082113 RepID=A0AC59Z5R6_RANTA